MNAGPSPATHRARCSSTAERTAAGSCPSTVTARSPIASARAASPGPSTVRLVGVISAQPLFSQTNSTGRSRARANTIASVTEPFCTSCDRTRISADGQLRSCLFSRTETDLRSLLRGGADDERLAEFLEYRSLHLHRRLLLTAGGSGVDPMDRRRAGKCGCAQRLRASFRSFLVTSSERT